MYQRPNSGGGTGSPLIGTRNGRPAAKSGGTGDTAVTEEAAQLAPAEPDATGLDEQTLRIARQISAQLTIPRPRRDTSARRGAGELASVPYRGGSDDVDLDATLVNLLERPLPSEDDIVVRERLRTKRSVVLGIDVSGSMRGERVRTAAATVGALFGELSRDDLAVVAFWSDAALLVPLGHRPSAGDVLAMLLRIPAQGLTNVAFPLQVAARQLASVAPQQARVLLLSDCVHNAGPDPRDAAARLPRVDVLLDSSAEHDLELAREIAGAGHGRLAVANRYQDVAPALRRLFTD